MSTRFIPTAGLAAILVLGQASVAFGQSPAPPSDDIAPVVPFTGKIVCGPTDYGAPLLVYLPDIGRWEHHISTWTNRFATRKMTDPRFAGTGTMTTYSETYRLTPERRSSPFGDISMMRYRLENDRGAWVGTVTQVVSIPSKRQAKRNGIPAGGFYDRLPDNTVFYGEGDYDGQVAFVRLSHAPSRADGCSAQVRGVIVAHPSLLAIVPPDDEAPPSPRPDRPAVPVPDPKPVARWLVALLGDGDPLG